MRVRLSSAALGDRRHADQYYAGTPAYARFHDDLRNAIRYISDYPEGAPRVRGEIRVKTLRRFPYSLLYRIGGGTVRILAIVHQSQDAEPYFARD